MPGGGPREIRSKWIYTSIYLISWKAIPPPRDVIMSLMRAGSDVNHKNNYGDTALVRAAEGGHEELCRILLEHGADMDIKDSWGKTALDKSKEYHAAIVTLLEQVR